MRVDQHGRRRRVLLAAAIAALPVVQGPASVFGAPATWDGGAAVGTAGNGNTWSDANNWTTNGIIDAAPSDVAPGDDLTFGNPGATPGIIDLTANRVANSLTFNQTGYTLGLTNATTFTLTVATAPVSVTAGNTATMNAIYAGTAGLTLTGGGTLALNRAGNTFTGSISVDGAGTVLGAAGGGAADPTALGAAGARVVTLTNGGGLSSIGTADLNPSANTKTVVIGTGGGTLDAISGRSLVLDDASQFSGTGNLTKTGLGTVTIDNQGYTYTGTAINVNAGTFRALRNVGVLGTGAVAITVADGAMFDVTAILSGTKSITATGTGVGGAGAVISNTAGSTGGVTGTVTLAGDTTFGGAGNLSLGGVVSDGASTFNVTKVGAGALILTGANAWDGTTTITAGSIRASATGVPATSNLIVNGGAFEPSVGYSGTLGTGAGQVQLPAGTSGFSGGAAAGVTVNLNASAPLVWGTTPGFSPAALLVNQTTAVGTMTLQNPIDLNGAARTFTSNSTFDGILGGVISGSAGVTVNGTGVTTFAAANTYTGATTLAAGTLSIAADNNIPVGGGITFNGGVLRVTGTAVTGFGSHTATFTSGANGGVDVAAAGNTFVISQTVANGAGGFTKAGAGTLSFAAGNALATTGTLTISGGGVLNLNQAADLSITSGTTINGTGGTLNIAGGGRLVVNTSATDIGTSGTLTINAVVANGATGNIDFFNSGGGTVVLTAANTWTGVTNIQNAIVSVASINSVVGGTATSNLGAPSSAANGVISIGTGTSAATLRYTGPGETTDRVVNLAGTTGGGTIDASGSGLLKFTSNLTATGAGSKTLTLTGTGTGEVVGAIVNNSGTNLTTVTKAGTGTWTVSGTSTYTGNTNINGGTLVFANGASNSTTPRMFLGLAGTSGAVIQRAGSTLSVGPTTGSSDVLGLGQAGGYGYYLNDGGFLTVGQLAMGGATSGTNNTGVFEQNGGSTTVSAATGYLITGWTGTNANGVLNIFAGTVNGNTPGQDIQMGFAASLNSFGMFNVLGPTAVFNATGAGTTRIVDLAKQTGNFAGVLNVNGGTMTANAVRAANTGTPTFLNFNGGTLKANVATTTFVSNLTAATIYASGATIDTNGVAVTIPQNLLAPTGSGLTAIPVTAGGAGYIGPPAVRITGGGGTGATAIAVVDLTVGSPTYGRVTGFTITSAGNGYTSAPTVTLVGGGPTAAATPGTAATGVTPTTGGLTKAGAGTLTLSGANTYAGPTVVVDGTLALSRAATNSIPNSSTITVGTAAASAAQLNVTGLTSGTLALGTGQTVGGHGSVVGALTIGRGSTVATGSGGIGTLSITNTLSTVATGTGADPTYAAELAGGVSTSSDRLQLTGSGAAGLLNLANPDVLNLLPLAAVGGTPVTYTIATFAGLGVSGTQTFDSVLVNGSASQSGDAGAANYVLVTYTPGDGATVGSGNIQVTVANLAAVPEPSMAGLAAFAAVGLLARRRRHRRPA